mgnify:CR=1 FL=1
MGFSHSGGGVAGTTGGGLRGFVTMGALGSEEATIQTTKPTIRIEAPQIMAQERKFSFLGLEGCSLEGEVVLELDLGFLIFGTGGRSVQEPVRARAPVPVAGQVWR